MTQLKEFMLIFRFTPQLGYEPTAQELEAMHQHWGTFIGGIAIREKLVSTHQLGFEGKQILHDSSMIDGICIADSFTIGGNMIVKATNLEEAVDLAKDCPILLMGGSVEVRNINPM